MKADISKPLANLLRNGEVGEVITNHYFSEGVCIREMIAPKGAIIIGAIHTTDHLTTLVSGTMQIRIGDESKLVEAPTTFESLAGSRKIGLAYTDCIVHNVFPTDSKNVLEIEHLFMTIHDEKYQIMLAKIGMTAEQVEEASFDDSTYKADGLQEIKDSFIAGKGLFAIEDYRADTYLGLASSSGVRNEFGRYVNHSDEPNLKYEFFDGYSEVYVIADVAKGEEFTVDYEDNVNQLRRLSCQEQ